MWKQVSRKVRKYCNNKYHETQESVAENKYHKTMTSPEESKKVSLNVNMFIEKYEVP